MEDIKLKRGSGLFFLVLFVLLTLSFSATYYKYMVLEDYEVFLEFDEEGNLMNIE
jgi:hypothetical protein